MKSTSRAAAVVGASGVVAVLIRRAVAHRRTDSREDHWAAVTINRSPEQVDLVEPLMRLRTGIEVRIRPAAGDKGTELLARPIEGGGVTREELRVALRQAKALIETGQVLRPDSPPSTHPGPAGRLLRAVIGKSAGEGRL